jgi:hypothetical protein
MQNSHAQTLSRIPLILSLSRIHTYVRTCARTRSQEFARGVKYLNFVPPIIIDEEAWHAEVVARNFTVQSSNGVHRIGKEGEVVYLHRELRTSTVFLCSLCEPPIALSPFFFLTRAGTPLRVLRVDEDNDSHPANAADMWCDAQ